MDKNKQKEFLTGLFILLGVALLLTMLFFLGLSDIFTEKVIVRTGFSESVQGLSRGSAVKYRGVPIGTVTGIYILVKENIIQIDMEIDPACFASERPKHRFSMDDFSHFFRSEIKEKGLRARLEMVGITGMKYIDFDYFARPGAPIAAQPRFTGPKGIHYIPAVNSQMKDIVGTLTLAVDRLSRIRFERISEQLESALTGMGQLLNSQEIRSTIARINDTAENLEVSTRAISTVLSESRIQGVVKSLEQNLSALRELQNALALVMEQAKIPETASDFRRTLNEVSDSRKEIDDTMQQLSRTLEAIRVLADNLSTDPASLLRGKQQKTVRK